MVFGLLHTSLENLQTSKHTTLGVSSFIGQHVKRSKQAMSLPTFQASLLRTSTILICRIPMDFQWLQRRELSVLNFITVTYLSCNSSSSSESRSSGDFPPPPISPFNFSMGNMAFYNLYESLKALYLQATGSPISLTQLNVMHQVNQLAMNNTCLFRLFN